MDMLEQMNGIYAANEEEIQELMTMIEMLSSEGLDILIGWFRTSDAGIAVNPKTGMNLLREYLR